MACVYATFLGDDFADEVRTQVVLCVLTLSQHADVTQQDISACRGTMLSWVGANSTSEPGDDRTSEFIGKLSCRIFAGASAEFAHHGLCSSSLHATHSFFIRKQLNVRV